MKSLLYWHPMTYNLAMRILYGRDFSLRYKTISNNVPEGSSVIDVCCGDCYLYTNYLIGRDISYLGIDINPIFINWAKRKGIPVKLSNIINDPIPEADCIIMQDSLYQFIPYHEAILKKLYKSAKKMVIISEPIKNLADSDNPLISFIAKRATKTAVGVCYSRFNKKRLIELFNRFGVKKVMDVGRNLVGIFYVDKE